MRRLLTLLLLIAALLALGWSRWQAAGPAAAPVSAHMPMSASPESALPDLPPAATLRLPAPETLASTLVAHRASISLRAQDQERLATEPDLALLAAEWDERAGRGDADAAYAMAQLLTQCSARSLLETGTISAERVWMFVGDSVGPERVPEYQRDYADLLRRCGNLAMPSASAFYEAIRSWTRRAAELGQPSAILSTSTDDQARRAAAIELLQSGPEALAQSSYQLSRISPYSGTGWAWAACQLDPACAPDPLAHARRSASLRAALMITDGGYLLLDASPRSLEVAQGEAVEILALYGAGRWDLLVPGRP